MTTTYKFPAKKYDARGEHIDVGPWLDFIHAVNRIVPDTFGQPLHQGDWWAGGTVEEYPEARVVHNTDDSVTIVPLSDATINAFYLASQEVEV